MSSFMEGYRRDNAMTEELIATVAALLRTRPTERVGQILCNAMGWYEPTSFAEAFEGEPILSPSTLFNVYDEKLADGLLAYLDDDVLVGARADLALARALDLLDQFDRGTRAQDSEYPGSPFETTITEFLQEHGRREE